MSVMWGAAGADFQGKVVHTQTNFVLFVPLQSREILGSFPALLLRHLVVLGTLITLSHLSCLTSPGQNIIPVR